MRTFTATSARFGSGSNTIGRTMTGGEDERDRADQAPAAAAFQRLDVLCFSHAIASPTVRKEPNTTILSFSLALPSAAASAAPGDSNFSTDAFSSRAASSSARRAARTRKRRQMPARDARRELAQHAGDVLCLAACRTPRRSRARTPRWRGFRRAYAPPAGCAPRRGSPAAGRAAPGTAPGGRHWRGRGGSPASRSAARGASSAHSAAAALRS